MNSGRGGKGSVFVDAAIVIDLGLAEEVNQFFGFRKTGLRSTIEARNDLACWRGD
jgi:hypothetical protein